MLKSFHNKMLFLMALIVVLLFYIGMQATGLKQVAHYVLFERDVLTHQRDSLAVSDRFNAAKVEHTDTVLLYMLKSNVYDSLTRECLFATYKGLQAEWSERYIIKNAATN